MTMAGTSELPTGRNGRDDVAPHGDAHTRAIPCASSSLLKRATDYTLAVAGGAAVSPLALAIAAAIRLDSPGPAVFTQQRVGLHGRHYAVYKFRTMTAGAPVQFNPDGSTRVEKSDARITRVGRLLRGGLDELPQLLNVLRGEMSVVGPRPDMVEHEALYTAEERRKLAVRPGMTSLAAVLGRNDVPWKTRIRVDLRYIDRWSFALDLKIIAATLCLPLGIHPFRFDDVVEGVLDE